MMLRRTQKVGTQQIWPLVVRKIRGSRKHRMDNMETVDIPLSTNGCKAVKLRHTNF